MKPGTHAVPGRLRTITVAAFAAFAVGLAAPLAATAQPFLDPDDACLGDPEPAPFEDRALIREAHLNNVDCAFAADILVGMEVDGERFLRPGSSVTRAQMATIVVGALQHAGYRLPSDPPDAFGDDDTSVHEENINILAASGIVVGAENGRFRPQARVTRAQMVTMMVEAAKAAFGSEFEPVTSNPFVDVSDSNVHRDNIIVAFDMLGITAGSSEDRFDPSSNTRRDWIATFITRLVDLILIDAESPPGDPASGPTIDGDDIDREIGG